MTARTMPLKQRDGSTQATAKPTWEECRAAGLSVTEAARVRGVSVQTASMAFKKFGGALVDKRSERMKALHADPEFAARHRERMKALNADPEFAARNRERMKALNADPARNPLVLLTPSERADYDLLVRKGGMRRNETFVAIGRADLVKP